MEDITQHPLFKHINLDEVYGVVTPMARDVLDSKVYLVELAKRHPNAPKPRISVVRANENVFVCFDVYLDPEMAVKKAKGRDFVNEPIEMTVGEMLDFAYDQIVSMSLRFKMDGEDIAAVIIEPYMEKYFLMQKENAQAFEERTDFIRKMPRQLATMSEQDSRRFEEATEEAIEELGLGLKADIYFVERMDGVGPIVDITPPRNLSDDEKAKVTKAVKEVEQTLDVDVFAFIGAPVKPKQLQVSGDREVMRSLRELGQLTWA